MRFRLANTGAGGGLGAGMSNAVGNLLQLPMLRAQAADEAEVSGMKRHLMESQIAQNMARAAVEEQKRRHLAGRGDVLDAVIASQAQSDVPTLHRWREGVRTGVRPTTSATGYPEIDEMIGIKPQPTIDPEVAARLSSTFNRLSPAMVNPDDFSVQGLADATGKYQDQDVLAQAVELARRGDDMGMSRLNSVRGKREFTPFAAVGNTGTALNQVTGAQPVTNQGLNVLFGDEGQSRIRENDAQAGSARAAAGAHGASANLSNARRERVSGGYDRPVTVLDDDTGVANITRLPTGQQPVTVGVAPKKATGADATNAKERNRVTTAVEKEMVGASDEEIKAEVERRMARRGAPAKAPAAAAAAAPSIDMGKAAKIKADVKAGRLTREQGLAQLRALGFK